MNEKEIINNLLAAQKHLSLARKLITTDQEFAELSEIMSLLPGIIRRVVSSLRMP